MLESLYENIGGKIKNLAKWTFVVEAIGSVIAGIVLLIVGFSEPTYGVLLILVGPLVAFVSTWLLYGFGELIESNCDIRQKLCAIGSTQEESREDYNARDTDEYRRNALYATRRISVNDLERALSIHLMRKVTISEMACTLVYVLTKRGLPQEMHLELTVGTRTFCSLDLMLFDREKNAYFFKGQRLTLDEAWLPQDEIFDFDLSLFKSFETVEETLQ